MDPVANPLRRLHLATILAAGLIVSPSKDALATRMVPVSLATLTHRSRIVVVGRIKSRKAQWNRTGRKILTCVTLTVSEYLKGGTHAPPILRFCRLGGRIGRIEMRVVGAPRFRLNEEVVVFLQKRGSRMYVTAMSQGKFTVRRNPRTGLAVVRRNLTGIHWTRRQPAFPASMSLTALREHVRAAIRKERRKR